MGMPTVVYFMLLIAVKRGKENEPKWMHVACKYEAIKCHKQMKCSISDFQIMKLVPDLVINE